MPAPKHLLRWRDAWRDRRGVAAIEFALLAFPAVGLLIGALVVGISLYFQEALDYATLEATRQVQIGALPSGYSAASFTTNVFCPIFSKFMPCQNVTIDLQQVSDYYNNGKPIAPSQDKSGFCIGSPGQLMYVKVYYLAPLIGSLPFGTGGTTVNGVTGNYISSYAAFENENPTGAAVPAAAGC